MQNPKWRVALVISAIVVASLALAACGNKAKSPAVSAESVLAVESSEGSVAHDEEDADDDDHGEVSAETESGPHAEGEEENEDMADAHGIPSEEAERANPVPFNDVSIARGAELYQTSCAVCHGDKGLGDGVAGVALDPKPANFTEVHVQENTDGSLFYTISSGVEGTAMTAWQAQFSEEDRWHLVNFIRTLSDSE